jgi:hypothetical protein
VTTAPGDWDWRGFAGAAGGGAVSGTMGAVAGPVAGRFDSALTRGLVEYGIAGGGNALGNLTGNLVAGEDYSVFEGLIDAGAGSALSKIPGPDAGASLGAHYAGAAASQQLGWGVDVGKFALETQEVIP